MQSRTLMRKQYPPDRNQSLRPLHRSDWPTVFPMFRTDYSLVVSTQAEETLTVELEQEASGQRWIGRFTARCEPQGAAAQRYDYVCSQF